MKDLIIRSTKEWFNNITTVGNFSSRYVSKIKDQNFVVIGMRRLGKTQLLKEIANGYKEEEVLFIDIENPIYGNINFSKIDGKRYELVMTINQILDEGNIKLVLFDELQSFVGWSKYLKGMIDVYKNVKFVATGSDAKALKESSEYGVGRFSVYYMGMYSIEEYLNAYKDVDKYIEDFSFPQDIKDRMTTSEKFNAVIEKQVSISNATRININNVLAAIALNPGHKMTINKLSTIVKKWSDSKVSFEQVEAALKFLIDSELVISISDKPTSVRTSKINQYTLYPNDWNSYKYYTNYKYSDLTQDTIPRKGFVFENMIVSNIYSKYNSMFLRQKIFNKVSIPDLDIIVNDVNYEIKSFDFKKADVKEKIRSLEKAKGLKASIIHTGDTYEEEGIKCINWVEFIKAI